MMKREEKQLEEDLRKEQYDQDRVVMRYREYMNSQNNREKRQKYDTRTKANLGLAYGICVLALVGMLVLSLGIAAGYQQVAIMDAQMTSLGETLGVDLEDKQKEYQDVGAALAKDRDGEAAEDGESIEEEDDTDEDGAKEEDEETSEKDYEDDEETPDSDDSDEEQYYIVQKGDNLASISRKLFDTESKVEEICKLNDIDDPDAIYAGQKLLLP